VFFFSKCRVKNDVLFCLSILSKIVRICVSTYQVLEVSSFLMCFCLGSFSKTDTYHIENFGFITEKIYCKSHKIVARIIQVNFTSFLDVEFPASHLRKAKKKFRTFGGPLVSYYWLNTKI
jgi:hypothetical protein